MDEVGSGNGNSVDKFVKVFVDKVGEKFELEIGSTVVSIKM